MLGLKSFKQMMKYANGEPFIRLFFSITHQHKDRSIPICKITYGFAFFLGVDLE